MAGTVAEIKAATNKISRGEDLRDEMEILVGPYASWEDFLVPTPMCICLLGELMIISTASDFSLDKNPPKDGFKLIKYPNSFRACLMQVANLGWTAFNEANKNMDQIRLLSANVPGHLKEAVDILLKAEDYELEDMLPIPLNAIQETADECLNLATSVEQKFVAVMDLTAELLEACVSAKGSYEQEYKEVEIAREIASENKRTAEEQKKLSKQAYDRMAKSVDDAEKAFKDATESMPSGWDICAMNTVEGITNAFTTGISGVFSALTMAKNATGLQGQPHEEQKVPTATGLHLKDQDIEAYQKASLLRAYIKTPVDLCITGTSLNVNLKQNERQLMTVKQHFKNVLAETEKMKKSVETGRLKNITESGIELFDRLLKVAGALETGKDETTELADSLLSLQDTINAFDIEGTTIMGASPTDTQGPNQKQMPVPPVESNSAAKHAVENSRFKIEQTSAHLQNTRERYDKACDKMMESSEKLGNIMAEIAKLDIKKIDFETTRKTLSKGIKTLGELREQWGKIVMFFQMMSNLIKCSLNKSLKGFLEHTKVAQTHALKGFPPSKLKKDMIYKQAFDASKISHVVNMIAGSYVEISNQHLMHRIAGLGKLLSYDHEKDMTQIQRERLLLHEGLQDAQESIKNLVLKRKKEFDDQCVARVNKIKTELKSVLPPEDPSDTSAKRAQKVIQQGMQKVKSVQEDEAIGLNVDDFV